MHVTPASRGTPWDMPVVSAQKERPRSVEGRGLRWIPMRHVSLRPHPPPVNLFQRRWASPGRAGRAGVVESHS